MAELYKIGVEIALAGTIMQGLEAVAAKLLGIQTQVKGIESSFARWGLVFGGAGVAGGSALLAGMSKLADASDELLHQQALMASQGWSVKDMQDALNAAWKTSADIMTTLPSENLKHLADIAYATGGMSSAVGILPQLAQANAVLNAMKGGGHDEVFNLVKALEQKGLATPENRDQFMSYVDMMTKAVESSHGRVTPAMFQRAFVYGRTAMLGWDENFITEILPRLIQSMAVGGGGGGSGTTGPGNALMSAFAKVVQGQMPKNAAEMLQSFGLADVSHITGSSQSQTNVHGAELFGKDPYEWVQTFLVPALKARGIDMTDNVAVGQAIAKMFPVRTASSVLTEMALQGRAAMGAEESPFEKDRRLTLQAMGAGQSYASLGDKDPFTIWAKLTAQMKAFGEAMSPLEQLKLDWLKDLTPFVSSVSQMAMANPGAVKLVGEALGGLAIGLAGLGAVAVITGAAMLIPGGLATVAVAGLGAALASIAAMNWNEAKAALEGLKNWILSIPQAIATAFASAVSGLKGIFPSAPAPGLAPGEQDRRSLFQKLNPTGKLEHQGMNETPAIHNKVAVYLDGRVIGESMSSELAQLAMFPRQGAYSDPYLAYAAPDINYG